MAQAGAMVYVVAAKTGAHQFLKQIGFFITAFGRAETGQRFGAMRIAQSLQSAGSQRHGFFPGGFAEHG